MIIEKETLTRCLSNRISRCKDGFLVIDESLCMR